MSAFAFALPRATLFFFSPGAPAGGAAEVTNDVGARDHATRSAAACLQMGRARAAGHVHRGRRRRCGPCPSSSSRNEIATRYGAGALPFASA
jgi:hypothetical protein